MFNMLFLAINVDIKHHISYSMIFSIYFSLKNSYKSYVTLDSISIAAGISTSNVAEKIRIQAASTSGV